MSCIIIEITLTLGETKLDISRLYSLFNKLSSQKVQLITQNGYFIGLTQPRYRRIYMLNKLDTLIHVLI